MGWRGIMLGSGEVWMDFDGKVIGKSSDGAGRQKFKAELIARQKSGLHPSVREYKSPS